MNEWKVLQNGLAKLQRREHNIRLQRDKLEQKKHPTMEEREAYRKACWDIEQRYALNELEQQAVDAYYAKLRKPDIK